MNINIDHIAYLSQLEFTEIEKKEICKDMTDIIDMIGELPAVSDILQDERVMELRSDNVEENRFSNEEMLMNAHDVFNGFIAVPKTVQ